LEQVGFLAEGASSEGGVSPVEIAGLVSRSGVSCVEFFATAACDLSGPALQSLLVGPRLAEFCASIDQVIDWQAATDEGEMDCLWGRFRVRREVIRDGLRFTLPYCPNALAWTITVGADGVGIHCTINRPEHDPDFVESIEEFVADWQAGLQGMTAADDRSE
jgi:hypothetical protein